MKTSPRGIDLIRRFEGVRLKTYKDAAGKPTIGIGHLLKPGEKYPHGITEAEAEDLLRADLADAEKAVAALGVKLRQPEFDALASFAYNLGGGALASSTLAKRVMISDAIGAAVEFVKWIHVGGKPLKGLLRRRLAEATLFLADA